MATEKENKKDKDQNKPANKIDKEKLDQLEKERQKRSGIPFENQHSSSDPNRAPAGDDRDVNQPQHHEGYVEPYNKKTFHNDKKTKK